MNITPNPPPYCLSATQGLYYSVIGMGAKSFCNGVKPAAVLTFTIEAKCYTGTRTGLQL